MRSVSKTKARKPAPQKSRKPECAVRSSTPIRRDFVKPFEVLPVLPNWYVGDQHGAAVEFDRSRGSWGSCPTYATREEAEERIREIMLEEGDE